MIHSDFIYINPSDDIPRADEVLNEFSKIVSDNNLDYFLLHGTALGFYRDSGYIKGDSDIDVGMILNNHKDYVNFVSSLIESGFEFYSARGYDPLCLTQTNISNYNWNWLRLKLILSSYPMRQFAFHKNNIQLDIFLCELHEEIGIYTVGKQWHIQRKFLDKFDVVKYKNKDYKVPYPIEEFLEHIYGKYWRVPIRRLDEK